MNNITIFLTHTEYVLFRTLELKPSKNCVSRKVFFQVLFIATAVFERAERCGQKIMMLKRARDHQKDREGGRAVS
jgi:hypothetical protein